ncbi:MAG TPA: aminotransferase class I/II-fold pyridoxal phosphate-dependent enzyme [Kofleriaceae bacterium]|nr:aminotransferase class I/II-fold pyridoxal phosphate-dependent enzyme [Kofleriaceae bacterium]
MHVVPESHLEGELHLDDARLTTVLAALRTELGLPSDTLTSRFVTVRQVLDDVVVSSARAREPRPAVPAAAATDHRALVLEVFRHHTHYDVSELRADANLEGELGVDSVLLASILGDLRKRLGLPKGTFKPESVRTIDDVLATLRTLAPSAAAEPAPPDGHSTPRPGEKWQGSPMPTASGPNDSRSLKDFTEERSPDLFAKVRSFNEFYKKRRDEHLLWYGMPLESACRNRAVIYDDITGKRREFLMFASNNYLGLANHPRVVDAVCDAVRTYGATNTGCRLIGGTNVVHKELERRIARFKGREACIVYPSGYSANLGSISALAKSNDAVVIDKFNHMSILDGCKLSGAARKIYQHNDMADLERILERLRDQVDGILIVTDGVFSMHGDICKLPDICRLASRFGAKVLVDDAHSTGVLGARGSGTAEHFGLKGEVDLELGTMSKALAGLGGFVVGDEAVIDYLRFYSNSYAFAANIPAATAAGLIAALDVLEAEPERLQMLWRNIRTLKQHLTRAGFDLGDSDSAVIPIVIGDDAVALRLGRAVRERGMFCQTVVYPGVSVGDARLRVSVSSEHTQEDLDLAAQIIVDAAREVHFDPRARAEAAWQS